MWRRLLGLLTRKKPLLEELLPAELLERLRDAGSLDEAREQLERGARAGDMDDVIRLAQRIDARSARSRSSD